MGENGKITKIIYFRKPAIYRVCRLLVKSSGQLFVKYFECWLGGGKIEISFITFEQLRHVSLSFYFKKTQSIIFTYFCCWSNK